MALTSLILIAIEKLGLYLRDIREQSYNNKSNMRICKIAAINFSDILYPVLVIPSAW